MKTPPVANRIDCYAPLWPQGLHQVMNEDQKYTLDVAVIEVCCIMMGITFSVGMVTMGVFSQHLNT